MTKCIVGLDGTKEWYINGKPHREDGPAVEDANGTKEWWLNNVEVSPYDVLGNTEKATFIVMCDE